MAAASVYYGGWVKNYFYRLQHGQKVDIPSPSKEETMKTVRDYYTVKVPGDAADTIQELAELAINEARERAKLYCIPASWTPTLVSGEVGDCEVTFRVCRRRYKNTNKE